MIQSLQSQQAASQAFETDSKDDFPEDHYDYDEYEYENYDDEDEPEEDYNIVLYNLPDKKVDKKKEKLLKETLKQRNQQLLEKKKAKIQTQPFIFSETNNSISIKKSLRLSHSKLQVKCHCYIPEKALLLVLLSDGKTLHIYNTMNFKLTAIKKYETPMWCITYSKHLKMILAEGCNTPLRILSPKTFEIEARSLEKEYSSVHTLAYVPKANIIVAVVSNKILLYNTGLRQIHAFPFPYKPGFWNSEASEIQGISNHLVLVTCRYAYQKKIYLINVKKKTIKEWENILIPSASCVVLTENIPRSIFTCLSVEPTQSPETYVWSQPYKLTQFTVDFKTEEFSFVIKTLTDHSFSKLCCIENSKKYFLAEKTNSNVTCVLEVKADKVEILHIISGLSILSADQLCKYLLIEAKSAIVQINEKNMISVYGCSRVVKKSELK